MITDRKEYMRKYQAKHREKLSVYNRTYNQAWYLRRRYNITEEKWEEMFNSQDRKCKTCKVDHPRNKNGWQLDHDHTCCPGKTSCGKCIRGILCQGCNTALGAVRDNLSTLKSLTLYLENFKPQ